MSDTPKRSITALVADYGKRLRGFVRGRVRNESDADDVVQDVWQQLSSLSNLEDLESTGAWLYQVARNRITDLYRRKKPDALEDYSYEDEAGEQQFRELLLLDPGDDPDLNLFKELFWEELFNALDELPEAQREAFVLNELEDMTLQEIADLSGENLKTIISRKRYAVQHLRRRLAHLYQDLQQ